MDGWRGVGDASFYTEPSGDGILRKEGNPGVWLLEMTEVSQSKWHNWHNHFSSDDRSLFQLFPLQNIINKVNIYVLCRKVFRFSSFWNHIKGTILNTSFPDLLLSFNVMFLRFNHVDGVPLVHSFLYNIPLYDYKAVFYLLYYWWTLTCCYALLYMTPHICGQELV